MTISSDLLKAILAMDAYNQGYNKGLDHGKSEIGTAVMSALPSEIEIDDWSAAGFYAISYDTDFGKVISYRGTDKPAFDLNPWSDEAGGDIWNGYGSALGSSNTNQARMAAEFYQAVTGTSDGDPRDGSTTLVGHSLGGGLAGFVASIYGVEAMIYDNMPFEAAQDAYDIASDSSVIFANENESFQLVA